MQILLFLYLGSSLLLALIALPLIAEKVKPNPFYGFRIAQTLENPQIWYATNKYFAKRQLAAALTELIAAIGLYFVPGISIDGYALACLAVFIIVFGFALVQSWRYLKTLTP